MCLNAGGMGRQDWETETLIPTNGGVFDDVAAFSIMPMNSGKDYKARETDVSQPLMAGGPVGGNQGGDFVVAFGAQNSATQGDGVSEHISATLDKSKIPAVAFDLRGREGGAQFEGPHDTANIRAASGGSSRSYVAASAVRRLTPTECHRLQGFPDDHCAITYRGKPAADGPQYKALGNSMAVPCIKWILDRIRTEISAQEIAAE
jgi:DNA (cytosine-5)-methyltransferase 1